MLLGPLGPGVHPTFGAATRVRAASFRGPIHGEHYGRVRVCNYSVGRVYRGGRLYAFEAADWRGLGGHRLREESVSSDAGSRERPVRHGLEGGGRLLARLVPQNSTITPSRARLQPGKVGGVRRPSFSTLALARAVAGTLKNVAPDVLAAPAFA